MNKRPISLHKNHIILNIKPQILRFKQERNIKQVLAKRPTTCHQFSFISLDIRANDLEPQKFISYLKQLKSLKALTIDLISLLQIPEYYIQKIFGALKYLKNLSVLHFQLVRVSYPLYERNFRSLCKSLSILHDLTNIQVKLSVNVSEMNNNEGQRLGVLLESLGKCERCTWVNLVFLNSADIAIILDALDRLKVSKAFTKFSLTFEKCKLCPSNRLHELFLTLKEIKSLKHSEVLFKECDVPGYPRLKALVPFIGEVGQNGNISIRFENYRHIMTTYERLLFTKSVQNVKSSHRIRVQFIENSRIVKKLKSSCRECGSGMIKCLISSWKDFTIQGTFIILLVACVFTAAFVLPLALIPVDS